MNIDRVQAAVDAAFVTTGVDTPGWPDPRPDGGSPPDDWYSRCLEPARYAIIRARVLAWVQALVGLGLADLADAGGPNRWLLRPHRAGALPMLLDCRGGTDGPMHVGISVGEPAVEIDAQPSCACDACDSGSAGFLLEVDDGILDVVSGALVRVEANGVTAQAKRNGWGMSGDLETVTRDQIMVWLADARAGRSTFPSVHGACWWDE